MSYLKSARTLEFAAGHAYESLRRFLKTFDEADEIYAERCYSIIGATHNTDKIYIRKKWFSIFCEPTLITGAMFFQSGKYWGIACDHTLLSNGVDAICTAEDSKLIRNLCLHLEFAMNVFDGHTSFQILPYVKPDFEVMQKDVITPVFGKNDVLVYHFDTLKAYGLELGKSLRQDNKTPKRITDFIDLCMKLE